MATTKNADRLLIQAAATDARRTVPVAAILHTPLVPPDGWEELRPFVERRYRLGLKQGEVAAAANCSATKVCQLERGRCRITPRWIRLYCEAIARCERALEERASA